MNKDKILFIGVLKSKTLIDELSGDERHLKIETDTKNFNSVEKDFHIGRYATVKRDMKIDTIYNLLLYYEELNEDVFLLIMLLQ